MWIPAPVRKNGVNKGTRLCFRHRRSKLHIRGCCGLSEEGWGGGDGLVIVYILPASDSYAYASVVLHCVNSWYLQKRLYISDLRMRLFVPMLMLLLLKISARDQGTLAVL